MKTLAAGEKAELWMLLWSKTPVLLPADWATRNDTIGPAGVTEETRARSGIFGKRAVPLGAIQLDQTQHDTADSIDESIHQHACRRDILVAWRITWDSYLSREYRRPR